MPNYESRFPAVEEPKEEDKKRKSKVISEADINGVIGGALKILDGETENMSEQPKEQPKQKMEVAKDNLYRDTQTHIGEIIGGAAKSKDPHTELVRHLLTKTKDHHFYLLRHTARHLRENSGGAFRNSPTIMGAISDLANAKDKNHLADMILKDKVLGGGLEAGGFVDTIKNIGESVIGVSKMVRNHCPLLL